MGTLELVARVAEAAYRGKQAAVRAAEVLSAGVDRAGDLSSTGVEKLRRTVRLGRAKHPPRSGAVIIVPRHAKVTFHPGKRLRKQMQRAARRGGD